MKKKKIHFFYSFNVKFFYKNSVGEIEFEITTFKGFLFILFFFFIQVTIHYLINQSINNYK